MTIPNKNWAVSVEEFINNILIGDLGSMLSDNSCRNGYHYELFILISIGIEFLGACEDSFDWFKRGESEKRFMAGLKLLRNQYHKDGGKFLYPHLRCSFAHVFIPGANIGISDLRPDNSARLIGLRYESWDNYSPINIKILYEDFKMACLTVIDKIKNKKYPKSSKVYNPLLCIPINNRWWK